MRAGDATTACLGGGAMPRSSVRETHPVILGGWPQSSAETTSVGVREPPDPYSISIAARRPVRRSGPLKRPVPRACSLQPWILHTLFVRRPNNLIGERDKSAVCMI